MPLKGIFMQSENKDHKVKGSKNPKPCKGETIMKQKVQEALNKIRPMLQADGGDVELVDVQDGIVTVRLQGACGGCPMSQMTLKNGIERVLKKEIPEVVSVESAI
jgi:Fe-S cluster biogenesis protein NfuA